MYQDFSNYPGQNRTEFDAFYPNQKLQLTLKINNLPMNYGRCFPLGSGENDIDKILEQKTGFLDTYKLEKEL